jgi:hypothetical protein
MRIEPGPATGPKAGEDEVNVDDDTTLRRKWTAAELRKLPPKPRDTILVAAAALAEEDDRNNAELTAFEAFGEEDLHGDRSHTETR